MKQVREPSGSDKKEVAESLLKTRVKQVDRAKEEARPWTQPKAERATFGQLLDALEAEYKRANIKSLSQTLGHLGVVRRAFGSSRAITVTTDRVRRWAEEAVSGKGAGEGVGLAPATVNRRLEIITRAFKLGWEEGRVAVGSVPRIRLFREDNTRRGFFEAAEFELLAAALPEPLGDFARFAWGTGWRRGEIASLRWQDVDRKAGEVRLPDSKNGEGRTLPLDARLSAIIERRWEAREFQRADGVVAMSALVFHRGDGRGIPNFTRAWRRATVAAGCPGRIFHDLRRSAVRAMIRAGVPQQVAKAISGHKTDAMFQRYNISSTEDLAEALRRRAAYDADRAGNLARFLS